VSFEEALAWLRGERSLTNIIPPEPERESWNWLRSVDFPSVRSCQMVWVVKHWLPEYNILVRLTLCVWALYI
jgi:hypothetical protein